MLTVRFGSGLAITYNDANHVQWNAPEGGHTLYTRSGGQLVATVPEGAIIEFRRPCVISKPHEAEDLDNAIRVVADALEGQPGCNGARHRLADIKRYLRDFDARTMDWR